MSNFTLCAILDGERSYYQPYKKIDGGACALCSAHQLVLNIVFKYVKKSAQNTAYSIFKKNTYEHVNFSVILPEKIWF
jgi:hypothetical protein